MGVLLSATILSACGSEAVGTKSTAHRWAVLLCKASDISTVPHTVDYYQAMFTDTKPDTQNARNYFLDQSYGTYDISSTDVMDWIGTDYTSAQLGPLGRTDLAQKCADSFKEKGTKDGRTVHFPDYTSGGVITIWNVNALESGSVYPPKQVNEEGGPYAFVNGGANVRADGKGPDVSTVSFFTHEMLHTLGLNHALGPFHTSNPGAFPINQEIDLGATHQFGALEFEGYGDCWTIMGCGVWTINQGGTLGEAGPGLDATQREYLGWIPKDSAGKDRIITYEPLRDGTVHVALAPENTPLVAGPLLIKIPITKTSPGPLGTTVTVSAGYYTVEFVDQSGWNAAVLRRAILIHEVRTTSPSPGDPRPAESYTYLIGRDIYGAWMPGQVFQDPDNHVYISIESFDAAASITLAPSGPPGSRVYTCDPMCAPTINILAPLDGASTPAGLPVTLQADVQDSFQSIPESQISWSEDGTKITTGRLTSTTPTTPGIHSLTATAYDSGQEVSVTQTVTLTVTTSPPGTPVVTITSPVDHQLFIVDPPGYATAITFVAAGSSDVASYDWVDSGVDGYLGSGQETIAVLHLSVRGGCPQEPHTITLRGTTKAGLVATKVITILLKSSVCIK
jgi:hypothetical protein